MKKLISALLLCMFMASPSFALTPPYCPCSDDYKPVCDSDGNKYPNECVATLCEYVEPTELRSCCDVTRPVCGFTLTSETRCNEEGVCVVIDFIRVEKTYRNECDMIKAGASLAHEGPCTGKRYIPQSHSRDRFWRNF